MRNFVFLVVILGAPMAFQARSFSDEHSLNTEEDWALKLRSDIEHHLQKVIEAEQPNKSSSNYSLARAEEHSILVLTQSRDGVLEMSCHDGPNSAAAKLYKSERQQ